MQAIFLLIYLFKSLILYINLFSRTLCFIHLACALTSAFCSCAWETMNITCSAENLIPLRCNRWRHKLERRNIRDWWKGADIMLIPQSTLINRKAYYHRCHKTLTCNLNNFTTKRNYHFKFRKCSNVFFPSPQAFPIAFGVYLKYTFFFALSVFSSEPSLKMRRRKGRQ